MNNPSAMPINESETKQYYDPSEGEEEKEIEASSSSEPCCCPSSSEEEVPETIMKDGTAATAGEGEEQAPLPGKMDHDDASTSCDGSTHANITIEEDDLSSENHNHNNNITEPKNTFRTCCGKAFTKKQIWLLGGLVVVLLMAIIIVASVGIAVSSSPKHKFKTPPTPPSGSIDFRPGVLTLFEQGLLLSEGLEARSIALSGEYVPYYNDDDDDESFSEEKFHILPDFGATFVDTRPGNEGGWVYVSNSEAKETGQGGVGAITFDADGNIINYRMVLWGTTKNCGGGKTPWNTWVSCEENSSDGNIFQVDPLGLRPPEIMTMGKAGGNWESFAYDVRNPRRPRFFVTEDETRGALRRFTPRMNNDDDDDNVWEEDPWTMLHGDGTLDYLMLFPDDDDNNTTGTYEWTDSLTDARDNAEMYYPKTEGVDVSGAELYVVSKVRKALYILNLDDHTYVVDSTVSGLFDGQPDQVVQVLDDDDDDGDGLLYFTEESGRGAGVHARDAEGRYYTILESPVYSDETTGLAFSPNGMHMYVAYQKTGVLFDIWRQDGRAFPGKSINVKYHQTMDDEL